eukprot:6179301-Pleurochrysis_carterae.AAC.1
MRWLHVVCACRHPRLKAERGRALFDDRAGDAAAHASYRPARRGGRRVARTAPRARRATRPAPPRRLALLLGPHR